MSEFNFKSQICTSRSQSERLLALGLKKETADMRGVEGIEHTRTYAWSLHRLIEMNLFSCDPGFVIQFDIENINDAYEFLVGHIEWLIKEGYFNKEYLVNQAQAEIEEHCKGVLEYLDYIKGEED